MQEDNTKDESTKKAAIYVRDSSTGPRRREQPPSSLPYPSGAMVRP